MMKMRSALGFLMLFGCGSAGLDVQPAEELLPAPPSISARDLVGGQRLLIDLDGAAQHRIDTRQGEIDYGRIVLLYQGKQSTLLNWLDDAKRSGQLDPRQASRDGVFLISGVEATASEGPPRSVQDLCAPGFEVCGPVKCDQSCQINCYPSSGRLVCYSTCQTYCSAQCCPNGTVPPPPPPLSCTPPLVLVCGDCRAPLPPGHVCP